VIKVKILNPTEDRNEPTFRPLFFVKDMLRDYSIDITDSDDFDYLFVGMYDFIYKDKSLSESTDIGLENLSKISGDYFLFDGSDSHSLMGSYEVFIQSDAIYLFKQQLHKDKDRYKVPKAFNKWFMGSGSDLDLSYNISNKIWNRIKLTGWNFMSHIPSHRNFIQINNEKNIDICAVFGSGGDRKGYDHKVRNDMYYTSHRRQIRKELDKLSSKYNIMSDRRPFQEYMRILYNSKICISPFGMGEIRQGDGESMQMGTIMFKENMSQYNFGANAWIENKTYIPFEYDCADLVEKLEEVIDNYKSYEHIISNMRSNYLQEFDQHKLCLYWYNIFKNLNTVETD
jgi:hypothetical protein